MNRINLARTCLIALAAWASGLDAAAAQRVLDLPVRAAAGADALVTGPLAVFWNPGSIGLAAEHGEAMIMDVRGPSPTGLEGLAVLGMVRLDERTSLAAGFQHIGIEDIERTSTSPLPDGGVAPLDVSETTLSLAAFRAFRPTFGIGAGVHYQRGSSAIGADDVVALGAGFRWAQPTTFHPTLAAGVRIEDAGSEWFAGGGVRHAIPGNDDWVAGGEYGVGGSHRYHGISHRAAALVQWREIVRVSAGVVGEPGVGGHTWSPAMDLGIQIDRYRLGVLREQLANDIGAVHSFRFSIQF